MTPIKTTFAGAVALGALATGPAFAEVPESCRTVRLAEVGWTDIQATTGVASTLLDALGYTTDVKVTSVPLTFIGLEQGDIDVFLGLWMPSMAGMVEDRLESGAIEQVRANLEGAKYTLVVPKYAADAGVTDLADLDAHKDQFGSKIYGIEPGNDGNQLIQDIIDADAFGLGDWDLVESSEAGMLLQASGAWKAEEWIVFLGWAPHPMNTKMDIVYLTGGDAYFGPNQGGATVYTLTRDGLSDTCSNLGTMLNNLAFTVEMENILMAGILDHGETAESAATKFIKANPALLDTWLDGVTTVDGAPGAPAVKAALGL
ncbi:choline ABC transporter substrate-binding protein [Roseospira marina]|uniref:Choline ABC transporter substrate-binding protein n=1 Tax=Roseospira marina TaxID=140057 RepID=A0A5M6ICC9_9PROT|nr:choline ABC transporter substrate-binding protein [Roseospira marina]KAA5605782.1 choline ABC transporter substrate-binding protein [Roseospira marina]MBB4313593.1 glycine betaine/proline transport system substrate-binding protein [Roseospira marina]MBB5086755.1 glycine betaine/proline transport system substrate-binding protein [Roseospira marina]